MLQIADPESEANRFMSEFAPKLGIRYMLSLANNQHDIEKTKSKLPIQQSRLQILQLIDSNPVSIIAGDTGCGKSTQVPQFILERCT